MTRRLVLLRHGETDHNRSGRAQGHLDVPLNDRGLAQARAVAPVIAAFGPAWIVSSDLARARVTAETVAAECGLRVSTDERLREFNVGVNRQDRTWAEYQAAFPDEAARLVGDFDGDVPGRESASQVLDRWRPGMAAAMAAVPAGGTGVLVAHGGVLRLGIADFLGIGVAGVDDLDAMGNCAWSVLGETEAIFRGVGAPRRWRLQAWNRQLEGASAGQ